MNARGRKARGMPLCFVHTPQIYCVLLYQIITARTDYFSKTSLHIATNLPAIRNPDFEFIGKMQTPTRFLLNLLEKCSFWKYSTGSSWILARTNQDVAQKSDLRHREGTLFGALMKNTLRISCSKAWSPRSCSSRVLPSHKLSSRQGLAPGMSAEEVFGIFPLFFSF